MNDSIQKAKTKLTFWKQKFLDLSNRNSQLNFKPSKKRYIEIEHPDMITIFKILVVLGQEMEFIRVLEKNDKNERNKIVKEAIQSSRLTEIVTSLNYGQINSRLKKMLGKEKTALEERGINILYLVLGLLVWKEDSRGAEFQKSPILFVPVKLKLQPPRIKVLNDSVSLNPALREKLLGERIKLPHFPDEFDSYSVKKYFELLKKEIEINRDWNIEEKSFIGPFAFTKAALYKDLDQNLDLILQHPIVRAIAQEEGFYEKEENLPDESNLKDNQDPLKSYSILDCDSSQQEAVEYAKSGCSLVIQGPPGTGKSQAIANIIAECLAVEKKVLFVAQKQAALNVVKKRLNKSGIGDFCLQVHSQNANKKDVLKQIEQSMNFNPSNLPKIDMSDYHEIKLLRDKLNEYTNLINKPFGEMYLSLYQMIGKLVHLEDVPFIEAEIKNPEKVGEDKFIGIKDLFFQLENFRNTLEDYDKNPWKYAKLTNKLILSNELKIVLKHSLQKLKKSSNKLRKGLLEFNLKDREKLCKNIDSENKWIQKISKARYWKYLIQKLFENWAVNESMYKKITQYFHLEDLFDYDITNLYFNSFKKIYLAYKEKFRQEKILKSENTSKRNENPKIKAQQKGVIKDMGFKEYLEDKISDYINVLDSYINKVEVFNLKSKLEPIKSPTQLEKYKNFFDKYKAKALLLDVDTLVARFTIDYTSKIKRVGSSYKNDKEKILSCLREGDPDANPMGHLNIIKRFQDAYGKPYGSSKKFLQKRIKDLYRIVESWYEFQDLSNEMDVLTSISLFSEEDEKVTKVLEKMRDFAIEWLDNLPYLNDWFEVQVRAYHLEDEGFGDLMDKLKNEKIRDKSGEPISFGDIFEKCFYETWLVDLIESLPPINNFRKSHHLELIDKFSEKDRKSLKKNQVRVQKTLYNLRPNSDLKVESNKILTQKGMIKRELKKKRNIKPLRSIFSEAKELIGILKPCTMMSPLAISNFLDLESFYEFYDVVIFDEASQVTPEDAIGAIMRGKSLVVVGDSNQLPPTTFFKAKISDELRDLDRDVQTMESLLDECTGIGFREKLLKFHYRSRKEGLIAFSNSRYYHGRLFSFPDLSIPAHKRDIEKGDLSGNGVKKPQEKELQNQKDDYDFNDIASIPAIQFKHVPQGIKSKGKNLIEANKVAENIITHYKKDMKSKASYSLGVIAFSIKQQGAIKKALSKKLKDNLDVERFMQKQKEPLFIKNLENVQGDERDFIFFSIGYGKNKKGKISLNFGPLNRSGGYRRLNVAITRARYHIDIFCSFLPSEIDRERVNARGLGDLLDYMVYARTGIIPNSSNMKNEKEEIIEIQEKSILMDLKNELEKQGLKVHTKVGVSNYRLDLAIIDPQDPNMYKVGIECDAGSYSDAEMARDRDRIRKNVMSALGWKIIHIWSKDWYEHKKDVISQIKQEVKT